MEDSEWIADCYDQHSRVLYAHAMVMTASSSDAEEVLQVVFTRLIQKENPLEGIRDIRAVLLKWVHDAAIDLIRSNARRRERQLHWQGEHLSPFTNLDDPDARIFSQSVWEALLTLPEDQRAVVHLKLWGDQTFETIADTLNIKLNTATSRYRYGLDKMRQRLRPLYEELKDSHG